MLVKPMESRKLQKTGGATYTVSLPKKWVQKAGLKEGDQIFITFVQDGSLILNHTPFDKKLYRTKVITLAEKETPEHILRQLIGVYLAGYSLIEIRSKERITPTVRRAIREFTRKVIGPEIIEETINTAVLQDISDPTELPLDKSLRRMYLVVRAMHDDALVAIKERDSTLAEDIISRDSEIDKLYWVIAKQYNMIVRDPKLAEKLGGDTGKNLNYKLAAKILERIGDHAAKIAQEVKNLSAMKFDSKIVSELVQAGVFSMEILDSSVKALFSEDVALANESIDMGEKLKSLAKNLVSRAQRQKNQSAIHLVSIVESIRRAGLYGTDIAEIAINNVMSIEKG
jgi:phosphate uptake regulator